MSRRRRQRTVKVVPASEAGYGHGSGWIARYYDPSMRLWFDIGDPHQLREDAELAAAAYAGRD